MTAWYGLLAAARGSLILLGSVLLTTLLAVALSAHAVNTLRNEHRQQQTRIASLQHLQQEQDFLLRHAAEFQRLSAQGLLQAPDRERWIDQLLAAQRQLDLPPTLNYTLPPPRPASLTTPAPPLAGTVWMHDLELSLTNIHEAELLALIDRLRNSITEAFRIQHCRLSQPREEGLNAQCTLRFFSLLPADAPP